MDMKLLAVGDDVSKGDRAPFYAFMEGSVDYDEIH